MRPLPPEIEQFIRDHIESLEELEILLLLRANQGKHWTADAVAQELRRDPRTSEEHLVDLAHRGFLASSPLSPRAMVYAAHGTDVDQSLKVLAEIYPRYRNSVIELIVSKPTAKLQSFPSVTPTRKRKDS